MKTFALTIVLGCVLSITSYAQQDTLNLNAKALFRSVSTKLTVSEQNTIAQLCGFTLNTNDKRLYKTSTSDKKNLPLEVTVFVLDLTNDGIEEIGITYHPIGSTKKEEIASMLFVKETNGEYKLNLDAPGEFYFLNMNDLVFPDIYLRNTAIGLPTYRWNGNHYIKHTFLNPKRLKRYVVSSMKQASSRYRNSQSGE